MIHYQKWVIMVAIPVTEKDRGNHGAGFIKGPEPDEGRPAGGCDKGGYRKKWW